MEEKGAIRSHSSVRYIPFALNYLVFSHFVGILMVTIQNMPPMEVIEIICAVSVFAGDEIRAR